MIQSSVPTMEASDPALQAQTHDAQIDDRHGDSASPVGSAVKHFVLDTNVLLHNPASLYMFEDNHVVIPFAVLGELDKFKKQNDDVGRNAREVIRQLDQLRTRGRLSEGVAWNGNHGVIRVEFSDESRPAALSEESPDHRIIGVAWRLKHQGKRAILVTKDINVRLKADALGIPAEDFEAQKVDADRLYAGYTTCTTTGELIDTLYEEKQLDLQSPEAEVRSSESEGQSQESEGRSQEFEDHEAGMPENRLDALLANQFVILQDALDPSHTGLARRLADTDHLIPIHPPRKPVSGLLARNVQQTMALDLLLDDEVKLVTLLGSAGTGKTLLALAAGMTKTFTEERYDKLLVARPIMPMGRDIGYLPGDKDEKLAAWMQPIFDNLQYLLSTRGGAVWVNANPAPNRGSNNRPASSGQNSPAGHADSKRPEQRIEQLMASGRLVLEPLTYIRGRSIPHQFIIVDEAQNLTPHEVKTIVSRVGEGTKIVLTGDVGQIDNPYLDSSSNGLSYMVERLKGQPMVGHVTLAKSERSQLASLAAEKL